MRTTCRSTQHRKTYLIMKSNVFLVVHVIYWISIAINNTQGFTPYRPTANWVYTVEATGRAIWPACANRFLTYTSDCSTKITLSNTATSEFTLIQVPVTNDTFYLKLGCGKYLSYAGPCDNTVLDDWPAAGINQEIRFVPTLNTTDVNFEWKLEAVGRASCLNRFIDFPKQCGNYQTALGMGTESTAGSFVVLPVRNENKRVQKNPNSKGGCADPFAWYRAAEDDFWIACTGGELDLYHSKTISVSDVFDEAGVALSGSLPPWTQAGNRWAPENLEFDSQNVMFFSDSQPSDGRHRVGWAMSATNQGNLSNKWDVFSPHFLNLGNALAGEIDQHIFRDPNGSTYLLWKTDDNSVGSKVTRIWGQEVKVEWRSVVLIGQRHELLDSSGLWWATSWVAGGALIEGPEVIQRNGFYYLFFAAGKFCQESYAEGVARAASIWGPYEKLSVPLLSTSLVGYSQNMKIIGPGHASYVTVGDKYYAVYAASVGDNCNRKAFIEELKFSSTGWPYINFPFANTTAE
eukprot:m.58659 g.58659  ORF g.58659 m.58659 type:complete len:518 (-) comp22594_c1_seq1:81-1634(-)